MSETIFLVTQGSYDDYDIIAAYSTEEQAEEHIAAYNERRRGVGGYHYEAYEMRVEAYPIDAPRDESAWPKPMPPAPPTPRLPTITKVIVHHPDGTTTETITAS